MDRRRHHGHHDGDDDQNMQAYYHHQSALMQQWPDPMHVDHQEQQQSEDISSWNYAGPATADWWLQQASQDQFNHFTHFPPQPSGGWPVDHYPSTAALDYQGAHFHPSATLPPADYTIPPSAQLIPDDELDSLLNPHPAAFPSDLELHRAGSQGKQRMRQRISSPAKAILQQWFDDHIEDPYLEKEDVSTLSEATGLTPRQVRTFFANARARKLPGPAVPSSQQQSPPAFSSVDSGRDGGGGGSNSKISRTPSYRPKQRHGSSGPSSVKPDPGAQLRAPYPRQQSPLQRYLSSSPEDEGVSEEALQHAAASYAPQQSSAQVAASMNPYGNSALTARNPPDTFSEAASSNSSNSSRASIDSAVNRVPRRGRKRHRGSIRRSNNTTAIVREHADPAKIYQCTFCTRDFAQKYDWRRHEESVHIPQREWTCMPDGAAVRVVDAATGLRACVFCEHPNPSRDHLARHNHAPCLAAPRAARTFTRKDKLIQHLAQVHKQAHMSPTMQQTWCRRVARSLAIACGICGARLPAWHDRVEHIAAHFAAGRDMRFWLGAPGGVAHDSSASVDPLFPAANAQGGGEQQQQQQQQQQQGCLHSCNVCPARFPRYVEAVWHERQVHRVFSVRPQPTEDGVGIAVNPLQQPARAKERAFGLGGKGPAAGHAGEASSSSSAAVAQQRAAAQWGAGGGGVGTRP
ncbi:homeodomain mating type protein alpha2 [Botryosphaeria dothidea]